MPADKCLTDFHWSVDTQGPKSPVIEEEKKKPFIILMDIRKADKNKTHFSERSTKIIDNIFFNEQIQFLRKAEFIDGLDEGKHKPECGT